MKNMLSLIALLLMTQSAMAQKQNAYIRNSAEVKGKHTIYTEIIIDASPEVARAKFLEFEKWPEWNSMIPQIAVKTGDINRLETEPTLNMTLDFSRKKDPAPAPVFPGVFANSKEVFIWGFKLWYLQAEHVHLFESIDSGSRTRFINYEVMTGAMKSFIMTKKRKTNMTAHFIKMNEEFKSLCEQ